MPGYDYIVYDGLGQRLHTLHYDERKTITEVAERSLDLYGQFRRNGEKLIVVCPQTGPAEFFEVVTTPPPPPPPVPRKTYRKLRSL